MFDLGPKQSRTAIIVAVLIYAAVMAGLFSWLAFNGEATVQDRISQTPAVTVTIAGKEPAVPDSWKQPEQTPPPTSSEAQPEAQQPAEEKPAEQAALQETPPAEEQKAPEKPAAPEQTPEQTSEQPAAETPQAQPEAQSQAPQPEQVAAQAQQEAAPSAQAQAQAQATLPTLPWQRYARPFDQNDTKPRISIIVADLGLASGATQSAVQDLPGEVTLAFSSSAPDLEGWIAKARAAGHETLLTIPMEPGDYPQNDPGPNTLLTGLDNKDNVSRLRWALARADGYVGIMPFMGDKFTTFDDKMAPVMDVFKEQGLMVVDNTMNRDSVIAPMSRLARIPFARADVVIDLGARLAIDAQLETLAQTAKERGRAVAVVLPYPVTFEKLKTWIPAIEQKGFALAPVTAQIVAEAPPVQATPQTDAQTPPASVQTSGQAAAPAAVSDPNRANNEIVQ